MEGSEKLSGRMIQSALECIIDALNEGREGGVAGVAGAACRALGEIGRGYEFPGYMFQSGGVGELEEPEKKKRHHEGGTDSLMHVEKTDVKQLAGAGFAVPLIGTEGPLIGTEGPLIGTGVPLIGTGVPLIGTGGPLIPGSKLAMVTTLLALAQKTTGSSCRLQEMAVMALGLMCIGERPHAHATIIIAGLCKCGLNKSIELQFTVGQALSCVAAGLFSQAAVDPWVLKKAAVNLPPTLVPRTLIPSYPGSQPQQQPVLVNMVLTEILSKCAKHGLACMRQAAGVWLVSILKYAGKHPDILARLPEIQSMFTDLLAEGDEVVTSIALLICY